MMARSIYFRVLLLSLTTMVVQAGGLGEVRFGKPGDPAKVDRTIEIAVSDDMRYSPDEVRVKRGQTIRFQVLNGGELRHMMVLGKLSELGKQAELMRKSPGTALHTPAAISIEPGQTGQLVWQFTNAGTFDFACLVPGHLVGGMKGKVIVLP
ncbi:MAG: cupredoxin family protein [Thiobacillus sp.]|nr:cupredoxin family protein [Thiobacillus sp.]